MDLSNKKRRGVSDLEGQPLEGFDRKGALGDQSMSLEYASSIEDSEVRALLIPLGVAELRSVPILKISRASSRIFIARSSGVFDLSGTATLELLVEEGVPVVAHRGSLRPLNLRRNGFHNGRAKVFWEDPGEWVWEISGFGLMREANRDSLEGALGVTGTGDCSSARSSGILAEVLRWFPRGLRFRNCKADIQVCGHGGS